MGRDITEQELLNIAGDYKHVARANSYAEINDVLKKLRAKICECDYYPKCRYEATDLTFVIDSSTSIIEEDQNAFMEGLDFITKTVEHFEIGKTYTRVAAVLFSTDVQNQTYVRFKENDNEAGVKKAIMGLERDYKGGNTNTDLALQFIGGNKFFRHTRRNAAKVAILVTDGHAQRFFEAKREADKIRRKFDTLLVVGVGQATTTEAFRKEVAQLAGGMSNVVMAGDYGR